MGEPIDELQSVTKQDSWYQFTAMEDSIKVTEVERKDQVPHVEDVEFDLDNDFVDQSQHSFNPPLGEDENYVIDTNQGTASNDPNPTTDNTVVHTFNIDNDINSSPTPQSQIAAHNNKGVLHSLLIHQVLTSEVVNSVIKFQGKPYKRARIFGTIIEKNVTQNNNMITVDDGTGRLKCFIKSDLNVDDYDLNGDADYPPGHPDHEFFRMMYEYDRADQETVPTFDEMKIGDRVCTMGYVKFYKDEFYLFVEKLSRHKGVLDYIWFLDIIFERYKRQQG